MRSEYLKQAVDVLLDALHEDAIRDDLNHRVALIEFSKNEWSDRIGTTGEVEKPYLRASPLDALSTHVISDFTEIMDASKVAAMKEATIPPHDYPAESYYNYAFSLARGLFTRELGEASGTDINKDGAIQDFEVPTLRGAEHDNYAGRPKIVLVIGDCAQTVAAKPQADSLKTRGVKIFAVHVYPGTAYQGNAKDYASEDANGNDLFYHFEEFDESLVAAFHTLSDDFRKPELALGTNAVVKDVVADRFSLSEPVAGEWDVKLFTADYLRGHDKNEMEFDTPVQIYPATPATITPVISSDGTVIDVSGFDFSGNFCSTIGGVAQGKKLIIEILIERKGATVGGPATATNAPGSGIKVNSSASDFLYEFESPTLDMPVDIEIEKRGLDKGESAVFTIRAIDGENNIVSSIKPFRIILTGTASGDPITARLKGLDKNYHWLITEEGWSWNYIVNGGDPSLSTANQLFNPFIFTNVKQDTTIKSAESKVTNDFKTGTATQVNSKVQ